MVTKKKVLWSIVLSIIVMGFMAACTPSPTVENTPPAAATVTMSAPVQSTPEPTATPTTGSSGTEYGQAQPLVEQAIADLAAQLNVRAGEIAVQQVMETEFRDTSLGVPEPGQMYAQVITPGYVIRLSAGDKVYEYHGAGDRIVQVPDTKAPQAPPLSGELTYHPVQIGDSGLSVEVPDGWLQLGPEWVWTPAADSALRLGVQWADLNPPAEPEAVLLPQPAQVLSSEPIDLNWATGRTVRLEVYGPSEGEKAPVVSVEEHTLIQITADGARRVFDLYASAPDEASLQELLPLLQQMRETSTHS